jgi:hypothetical protein
MFQYESEEQSLLIEKLNRYEKALEQIAQKPYDAEGTSLTWKDISSYQTRTAFQALKK